MQYSVLALLLSVVAAETTTYSAAAASSSSSVCAAQPVLEDCLSSTTAIAQACLSTDYNCLCSKYTDVLTCYLQCPNDSRYSAALSTQQTYCNDAAVYGTTTSAAVSAAVSGATTSATDSSTATTTQGSGAVKTASGTGTATKSSSTASSTAKSDGTSLVVGAGGLLMAVAGFAGAFL